MPIGADFSRGKGMKRSTLGVRRSKVKGQRSRSHEAEDRFGVLSRASLSTPSGRVAFLVFQRHSHNCDFGNCVIVTLRY